MKILVLLVFYLIMYALIEIYSYQAFKTVLEKKSHLYLYLIFSITAFITITYFFSKFDRSQGATIQNMYTIGAFTLVFVPKMILTFVLFGEDIIRILMGIFNYFVNSNNTGSFLPSRRKFVSQIGLGLAAIPFLSMIYGIVKGRYNYKVIKVQVAFADLPVAFDGFQITQISDVHSGSFTNAEKVQYAIDLVNEQNSDLMLFTGDIVNNKAEEMLPWIDVFSSIKTHKYGKFAVLGNHDYGQYLEFPTPQDKLNNFNAIKKTYGDIGFNLLLNQNTFIEKEGQKIAIVGVENWGKGFGEKGDIDLASENLTANDFKILLSHDPSHWEYVVKKHPKNFHLTLSGHTHGMQFGIEIPGIIKWSLVQYIYKQWAGLYENMGRYIYVNRGFGYHAFPGRVGIWPEITVITLKKG